MLKRIILWTLAVLAALVVILGLLLFAANQAVLNEPAKAAAPTPANSDYVTVASDERLFTMMAALNATGYDDENNEQGMHPVRQAVRQRLAGKNLSSVARLGWPLPIHPSLYVTYALQRSAPPEFARQAEGFWVEAVPPLAFYGLDSAMRDFYREANIADLWREYKPQYDAVAERYRKPAPATVQQVLTYLKIHNPPTNRVVVLPNLLDSYWRGYGERVGDTTYVIMGPSSPDNLNLSLIQHEAMHPILNPMVDANLKAIDSAQADRLYAWLKPKMSSGYPMWSSIMRETVIRAVEIRLADPSWRARAITQEESQGFMLVRPLAAKLEDYEKSGMTFEEYLPTLLKSLNDFQIPQ